MFRIKRASSTVEVPLAMAGPRLGRGVLHVLLISALVCVALPASPCGPYTATRLLLLDDEQALHQLPYADFAREIRVLLPGAEAAFAAVFPENREGPAAQSGRLGRQDLEAALRANGHAGEALEDLLVQYDDIRGALIRFAALQERAKWKGVAVDELRHDGVPLPDPPQAWPQEFRLYLEGMSAHRTGEPRVAVARFEQLLALPKNQRPYRTVWSAYMLGKVQLESDPKAAAAWFVKTRELAAAGQRDPLGLAASSFGWEGRAYLNAKQYGRAMHAYLKLMHAGDGDGLMSLHITARQAVRAGDEVMIELAKDATLQRVMTAYLLAKYWPYSRWSDFDDVPDDAPARWLHAVEAAWPDKDKPIVGADRLAWLAYQNGAYDDARWWAGRAGEQPIATWVRAKLALRNGRIDEGAKLLAAVVKAFPADEAWYGEHPVFDKFEDTRPGRLIGGELAVLALARSQYTDALQLLIDHGYDAEVHYLAEHVLTIDECKAFVTATLKAGGDKKLILDKDGGAVAAEHRYALTRVLANRLIRAGRWKEAKPFLGDKQQKVLADYVHAIRSGHDKNKTKAERAEHFWVAATMAKTDMAAMLDFYAVPPYHVEKRYWYIADYPATRPAADLGKFTAVSADELKRLKAHAPEQARDQHAAFVAAAHAWNACALMPDNDERTAYRLTIAGSWIMYRDPKAADKFYKALATRCADTPLGKEANKKRWFPKLTDDPLYLTK